VVAGGKSGHSHLSLTSLPKEIVLQILWYLDYDALHAFCGVCSNWNNFMVFNKVWKFFALQDEDIIFEKQIDFKVICKEKHIGRRKRGSDDKIIQTVGRIQTNILRKIDLKFFLEELKKLAHAGTSIQRRIKDEGIVRSFSVIGYIHLEDEQLMNSLISFFFIGTHPIFLHDEKGDLEAQHVLKEQGMLDTALLIFIMHKRSSDTQLLLYLCSFFAHQAAVEGLYLIQIGLIEHLIDILKTNSHLRVISAVLQTLQRFSKYDLSSKETLPIVIIEVLVTFLTKENGIAGYCLNILESLSHSESVFIGGLPSLLENIVKYPNLSWEVQLKSWIVYSKTIRSASSKVVESLKILSGLLRKPTFAPIAPLSEALAQMSMNKEFLAAMVHVGMMKQVIDMITRCSEPNTLNNLCIVLLNASHLHDEILEDVFAARIMDNVISICETGQKTVSLDAAKKLHEKSNFFRLFLKYCESSKKPCFKHEPLLL